MKGPLCAAAAAIALTMTPGARQAPALKITSPASETIVSGVTALEAAIEPDVPVESVAFFVNGRLVCTVEHEPYRCSWDAGPALRGHHVRVVARLPGGATVAGSVRTKDVGHAERARVDAVLVRAVVTDGGRFVRGLTRQDFEVFENGVPQRIDSLLSEESPLDLVVAIDVSGSMEESLDDVKAAVKQFLKKLRPGDAATLVGFNDTLFIAAERETDPAARDAAVDLLASWGGTAMYDATVRVLDMIGGAGWRRGVVIFSDGDDLNSMTTREAAMARVESSDAMLYTIGFGAGVTRPALRSSLEEYARFTGGRAFFPRKTPELDGIFDQIVTELAHQYVLSYSPPDLGEDGAWRDISVRVRGGKFDVRARRGYRPHSTGGLRQ